MINYTYTIEVLTDHVTTMKHEATGTDDAAAMLICINWAPPEMQESLKTQLTKKRPWYWLGAIEGYEESNGPPLVQVTITRSTSQT